MGRNQEKPFDQSNTNNCIAIRTQSSFHVVASMSLNNDKVNTGVVNTDSDIVELGTKLLKTNIFDTKPSEYNVVDAKPSEINEKRDDSPDTVCAQRIFNDPIEQRIFDEYTDEERRLPTGRSHKGRTR